jgi:endonuclease YncB( thermonuclease family)
MALPDNLKTARVVDVVSGDTVVVLTAENQHVWIRLHGIDAPEEKQPFGDAAKQYTANQCIGRIVLYRVVGIDIYERVLANVYLEDGSELNLKILAAGLAWYDQRHAQRQAYADAEAQARKAGSGLWADENPTPPWQWRKERQEGLTDD